MTTENFTYWLKGFFEISDSNNLTEKQVQIIKDHLDLVFNKVTPDRAHKEGKEIKIEKEISNKEVNPWGIQNENNTWKGIQNSIKKKNPLEEQTRVVCSAIGETPEHEKGFTKRGPTVYC